MAHGDLLDGGSMMTADVWDCHRKLRDKSGEAQLPQATTSSGGPSDRGRQHGRAMVAPASTMDGVIVRVPL